METAAVSNNSNRVVRVIMTLVSQASTHKVNRRSPPSRRVIFRAIHILRQARCGARTLPVLTEPGIRSGFAYILVWVSALLPCSKFWSRVQPLVLWCLDRATKLWGSSAGPVPTLSGTGVWHLACHAC